MAKRSSEESIAIGGKHRHRVVPAQSVSDKKSYRITNLENGLKALLISDTRPDGASSNESAVALTIDVGNFDDPDDVLGLAHFIEHMIFMGSKKYPEENEYDSVITRNGGQNNAETEAEETCFYFEVPIAGLEATLDVFSNLLYEPLFLDDTIDRELSAIDAEFDQARQSNDCRCDSVVAQFVNGPAGRFSYGNRESLTKIGLKELQKRARQFFEENYRAEWMYLAIQAKMPLDELETLVERHFGKLKGSGRSPIATGEGRDRGRKRDYQELKWDSVFKPKLKEQVIHVEAIDNKMELILTWPLPSQSYEFKCKPTHFVEHLLDNEGRGGLIKRLKDLHLIQRAESQIHENGFDDNSMFSLFCMSLRLSKHGYKNIPLILENVQAHWRMIQRESAGWQAYYEELKKIFEIQFRFQGETNMMSEVQRLSNYLKYFPEERVLDGCQLYFDFDFDLIKSTVQLMADQPPAILICSQQKRPDDGPELVEYYTKAKYTMTPIPNEYREAMRMETGDPRVDLFQFPPPNQFVTTDFELVRVQEGFSRYPVKVKETELYELWYKPDTKFGLPKLYVNFQLILPLIHNNIRNSVLLDIFGNMLSRELIEVLHGANVAGYSCTMTPKPLGVAIQMGGFSQRLPAILQVVLGKLNEGFPKYASQEQFDLIKEEMLCSYVNILLFVEGLSTEVLQSIIEDSHHSAYDRYQVLHTLTFADILEFSELLFREFRLKCLVQGNATAEGAQAFVDTIVEALGPRPIAREVRTRLVTKAIRMPEEVNSIRVAAINKLDVNSATCHYFEVGEETVPLECAVQLLMMLMEEPLFDTLRTKQQLGYDVNAQTKYNNGLIGLLINVVSQENKFNLDEVEDAVNGFVTEEFGSILEGMEEEDFDESRNSLIELKSMPDQDLGEEVERNWGEIWRETYSFDRLDREIEWLKNCTKEDLMEVYDLVLDEKPRRKLCVQIQGNKDGVEASSAAKADQCGGDDGEVGGEPKAKDFQLKIDADFAPQEGNVIKDIAEFTQNCQRYTRPTKNAGGDCTKG